MAVKWRESYCPKKQSTQKLDSDILNFFRSHHQPSGGTWGIVIIIVVINDKYNIIYLVILEVLSYSLEHKI